MDLGNIKSSKSIQELLDFSIINIDKPAGPSSFQVDEMVKEWLGLSKTSHFGTLDPKVSGVLPIALNRACKLLGYFIGHDKTYVGILHTHKDIKIKIVQEIIDREFTGRITQLPPRRSKVKRQEREREVKKFEILEKNGKEVLFLTEVQAGTYIRKLVSDLGEKIGGAHMTELRRTKAGIFSEGDDAFVNLYDLKTAVEEYEKGNEEKLRAILIPAEIITKILPVVYAKKEAVKSLYTGKPIFKKDIEETEVPEKFLVFYGESLIEVARRTNEKDIIARPEFVMQPLKTED